MVDIINFKGNQIESPDNIPVGKEILVPGGRKSINITAWDGSLTTLDWNWPVTSRYITSKMDWRHPLGIDIGTQNWDEVYAARDGIVAFAGGDPGTGHGSGVGGRGSAIRQPTVGQRRGRCQRHGELHRQPDRHPRHDVDAAQVH